MFASTLVRPEVVLAVGGATDKFSCHQSIPRYRFSTGGLLMFFVWGVPLKSYSTYSAVLRKLAVNLPLKQTFVSLTSAMTPSLNYYYCTLCILPRCAF
jgi:hypothetical protein